MKLKPEQLAQLQQVNSHQKLVEAVQMLASAYLTQFPKATGMFSLAPHNNQVPVQKISSDSSTLEDNELYKEINEFPGGSFKTNLMIALNSLFEKQPEIKESYDQFKEQAAKPVNS